MRFIGLRRLSGPNVFTKNPVSVTRLELDDLTGQETTGYPGFAARLTSLLPGLAGRIETAAGIGAVLVEDPLRCVVRGAAAMLEANRQSQTGQG